MKSLMRRGLFLFSVIVFVLFSSNFYAFAVSHIPTSEAELFQRVKEYNVGWDYVPYCNDDAYWSIENNKCSGGTDSDETNANHSQKGYDITNAAQLAHTVVQVNAGWNWVPRCDENSKWDMDDRRCEGGNEEDD